MIPHMLPLPYRLQIVASPTWQRSIQKPHSVMGRSTTKSLFEGKLNHVVAMGSSHADAAPGPMELNFK